MTTTNYNLPTISDNMSADVVRDLNALAEAVDTELETVEEKVTSHLEQNTVVKHTANEISVVAPQGITATTTQQYLDALFTGYSSKLTDMVDALLLINPSLPLDSNSTMQDVLVVLASGEVVSGKKYATGNLTSSSANVNLPNSSGSLVGTTYVSFDMSMLDFVPSVIILCSNDKSAINQFPTGTWFYENKFINAAGTSYANASLGTSNTFRAPYKDGVVLIPTLTSGRVLDWYAYE